MKFTCTSKTLSDATRFNGGGQQAIRIEVSFSNIDDEITLTFGVNEADQFRIGSEYTLSLS